MTTSVNSRPLASGRVAEVYEWGDGLVVKLWRRDGHEDAAREARIARAACAGGARTPEVIELVEVEGRAGIVFERVDGPTMVRALTSQPWRLLQLARQLAELQAGLHRCPAPPGLDSLHHALERDIRRAQGLDETQQTAAIALLNSLPAGDRLCHGDLHPDNVVMSPRGPVIIDWANAAAGPPVADIARTGYLLRSSTLPSFIHPFHRLLITLFRAAFYRHYLWHYRALQPLDRRQLAAWAVPVAAARMSEGIAAETAACRAAVSNGIRNASGADSKRREA
jgi:aminoglycoside phosphotransferase (APT) family kinase protein